MHEIPAVFYPTSVAFIAKRNAITHRIFNQLSKHFPCQWQDSSAEAFTQLTKTALLENTLQQCCSENPSLIQSLVTHTSVNVSIKPLHDLIKNALKTHESSVIISDEVATFEKLIRSKRKKILLVDDPQQGIDAFNRGLIDYSIDSMDKHIVDILHQRVKHAQQAYFLQISQSLLDNLLVKQTCALKQAEYIKMVNQYVQQQAITEYYICETNGSLYCCDQSVCKGIILVRTAQECQLYADAATDLSMQKSTVEKIRQGQLLPYFFGQDFWLIDDWQDYLFAATALVEGMFYGTTITAKQCAAVSLSKMS